MILIFGRALTGVPAGGLPAIDAVAGAGAGAVLMSTDILGGGWGAGGEADAPLPPFGKGLRTTSPVGSGFRAGFAVMLSLELPGEASFEVPDGKAVLTLGAAPNGWPRIMARRLGLFVLSVTIRLFFQPLPPLSPSTLGRCGSVLGRLGAGEPLSSFSARALLTEETEGVSEARGALAEATPGGWDTDGNETIVSAALKAAPTNRCGIAAFVLIFIEDVLGSGAGFFGSGGGGGVLAPFSLIL